MTKPKCPVCGTFADKPLDSAHSYAIHECPVCQLRFSNPMKYPGPEWYERSPHYKDTVTEVLHVPMWIIQRDWRYTAFMALKLRPNGHLLDVGCGPGSFLQLAKSRGYQVAGIDVSPVAIKMATEKFGLSDVYVMSVEELLSQSWQRRFDVVCLFDVLEHLEDPVSVLSGLRKLLEHGGYLVCTVPSYQRWPPLFDPYVDLPPHHLTLWTIKALERCVSSAGFTVIKSLRSPLTTEQVSPHMLWRFRILLQLGFISTLIKAFVHAVIASPAVRILSLNPKAGGFTLMIVAQK